MGLRCSLLGHAFGDAVTERDRETRGAEVLITVRELERCERCGAERVIAENMEVRHLGADSDEAESDERPTAEESADSWDDVTGADADSRAEPEPVDERTDPARTEAHAGEGSDDATADITQYVERAEEPAPSEPEPGDAAADEGAGTGPPGTPDEDAEFIDAEPETSEEPVSDPRGDRTQSEPETADTASGATEEREPTGSGDGNTIEDQGFIQADPETPASERSSGPESSEDESERAEADSEPVEDDAIIMDNDAGEEARESDVGRRELADSGNMFEASEPTGSDGNGASTDRDDAERMGETSDAEWPGREQEGAPDPESTHSEGPSDVDEWPGTDQEGDDEPTDSSFQFSSDVHGSGTDPEAGRPGKTPSGLTSEGPVDVTGGSDDDPPKSVVCPECGYSADGVGTSLRAGDICPECHGGYLAERR